MKYVSIDIETTGLNPKTCQVLQIGAIIEDTSNPLPFDKIPKFNWLIKHEQVHGEPYALNMNKHLIDALETKSKADEVCYPREVASFLAIWMQENGVDRRAVADYRLSPVFAGKNVGMFDIRFLERLPHWKEWFTPSSRLLDPAILYTDWATDERPPSLLECKKRAGIPGEVAHDAIADAWDVILLLRKQYAK
mgnify:CR=1 FL=1